MEFLVTAFSLILSTLLKETNGLSVNISPIPAAANVGDNLIVSATVTKTESESWKSVSFNVNNGVTGGGCFAAFYSSTSDCKDVFGCPFGFRFTCNYTHFNLLINDVNSSLLNWSIYAEISDNDSKSMKSATTLIKVKLPLQRVSLTPNVTVTKQESEIQIFTCFARSLPIANINWGVSGSTIPTSSPPVITTETITSDYTYTARKDDNGKKISCTAVSDVTSFTRDVLINVIYPPNDTPSIQQIPAGGIVRGNEITLICTVTGGNPLAILTWNCDGTISNETTGTIASYSVTFVANRTSNNKICTCSASHVVLSYKPSMSHQLVVYYEPIYYPIINQTPPGHIISGTNVTLTCEILGGNPLALLSWNCTGVSRNNTSVNKASYSVEIVVNRTFNSRKCACSATHYIASFRPTVRHMLDVYFKPFLDNIRPYSPSNISATENKILRITLAINANPKPTIQWTFKADTGCNFSPIVSNTTTHGFLTSSSILIDKVRSSDFGEYTFTSNNTVGIFFRRFEVIKEAASKQEMCAHTEESTGIFVVGIVTLVVGLLSLLASVIFIVRNSFRNKTIKSSKSDEYTGVQKENPAFVDEYTTIQSEIEPRQPQEQSYNTYEECERKTEANPYSNVNTIGSEAKHPQGHAIGINTYEECGRNLEAHAYDTLDK